MMYRSEDGWSSWRLVRAVNVLAGKVQSGGVVLRVGHNEHEVTHVDWLGGMLPGIISELQDERVVMIGWNLDCVTGASKMLVAEDVTHGCVIAQKRVESVRGFLHV